MLDQLYQSLDPIAFSVGAVSVRWYGLAYIFGFILAGVVIYRTARRWRLRLTIDDVMMLMVCIAFGVILGARLGYVIFYHPDYFLDPIQILMFTNGGMSFHGGVVGAIVGGAVGCRIMGLHFLTMADLACIGAPIGLFFGRCANFVNGELWGKVTDLPWGVVFEHAGDLPRHPSQLYEAILEGIVLFLVLYFLSRKCDPPRPQGTFLGAFLVLYPIFRSLVEFVRVPDAQLGYLWGSLTMGQLLCIPMALMGIGVLIWSRRARLPQRL